MDEQTFNAVFWISIATVFTGLFGTSLQYCLKSKCQHCKLCFGFIEIDRRVDLEVQEELKQMEISDHKEPKTNEIV